MQAIQTSLTVAEAIEKYVELATHTLTAHSWKTWCKVFKARWGERDIKSLTALDINIFITERRQEGRAEATIKNQLATLKAIYKAAEDMGVDVTWPKRIARLKPLENRIRTFEKGEESRLRSIMHPLDFEIVELAASTGLRQRELWDLKSRDVNMVDRFILVRLGKGSKTRRVPIGKTASKLLKKMLSRGKEYVVNPFDKELSNRRSSIAYFMRDVWRPSLRAAGIPDFRWHDLRHCFASTMARAGKSIQAIQVCMGHSNIAQTMKYSHLNNKTLHDAVSVV